ncbi:MAG: dihydroorotase [Pseudomonadota bacterium]
MKTAYVNARLLDPASGLDATGGLIVENAVISEVGANVVAPQSVEHIHDCKGLCLAPGLIDLRVKTGEPGAAHRETLESAGQAAIAGGVTTMAVMPDTSPVIDDVALVEFIARRGEAMSACKVLPTGALTRGLRGEAISELGLMREAGAAFFTNADHALSDLSVLRRVLVYAAGLDAKVFLQPQDAALTGSGVMNAGALAARMGLAGMPLEAEWIAAQQVIILAERTGASVVLDQVTTARTVDAIEEARGRGIDIAYTIAAHHLYFNELDIGDYLTYCKVSPPFRSEDDRRALIEAVQSKRVNAVVSAHDPQPPETKRLPFEEASFGAAGLETALSAMISLVHMEDMPLLDALAPLTLGPAELLSLPQGRLTPGAPADLVLFDPDLPWVCDRSELRSRSTNSPFDGRRLQGRVLATIVNGKAVFTR